MYTNINFKVTYMYKIYENRDLGLHLLYHTHQLQTKEGFTSLQPVHVHGLPPLYHSFPSLLVIPTLSVCTELVFWFSLDWYLLAATWSCDELQVFFSSFWQSTKPNLTIYCLDYTKKMYKYMYNLLIIQTNVKISQKWQKCVCGREVFNRMCPIYYYIV